ncbi:Farnesoate epoxidase [Chionoecetes opilio]|uniref:Farnesoate epoxidase n=1 Tax=Chionoecetes opilio TaxID=41210 RepID=A0A8J4YFA4_CHIOP|nr:Farnesoate epoxidase [Chionoecetes opilio]
MSSPYTGFWGVTAALWHNNRGFLAGAAAGPGHGQVPPGGRCAAAGGVAGGWGWPSSGRPAPVPHALNIAIINVFWQLVGGREFDVEDPKLKEFDDLTKAVLDSEANIAIQDFLPWLRYLMPTFLFKRLVKQDALDLKKKRFCEFFYCPVGPVYCIMHQYEFQMTSVVSSF